MAAFKLNSTWAEVKEKILEAETSLTHADLEYEPGNEDALLTTLSRKLGKSKEAIRSWIESVSYTSGLAG